VKYVLWLLWHLASPATFGCSVVLAFLAFAWLVFVYQISF
jgi:hypothetical protein